MEKKNEKKKKIIWSSACALFAVFTIIGLIKGLFVGLDVDESSSVAMAYRLVTGDKLILDMWEPNQFSAFLPALFLYPFYKLTGSGDYSVLYLRFVGLFLHFLVGIPLFLSSKKKIGVKPAILLFIVHLNFLSRWITSPEFTLMHYWCRVLIFIILLECEEKNNFILYFMAGILFAVSVLCCPSVVLIFPVYVIALVLRKKHSGILPFALGTVCLNAFIAVKILLNVPLSKLPFYISYIHKDFSDTSWGLANKAGVYLDQIKRWGIEMLIAFVCALIVMSTYVAIKNVVDKSKMSTPSCITIGLFTIAGFLSIKTLSGYIFDNQNQFYLTVRYIAYLIGVLFIVFKEYKKNEPFFLYGIIPAIASFPAVLLIADSDPDTLLSILFPSLIAGAYSAGIKYIKEQKYLFERSVVAVSFTLFLACIFVCRIAFIRVNGCPPVTITAKLDKVENGAAAGIYVLKDQADAWNDSYDVIKSIVDSDENVLYIGQEQLFYVTFSDKVNVPSVQSTTVFNEMYSKYYEVHPAKRPHTVVIDASFTADSVYYYSDENEYIYKWMKDNKMTNKIADTGYYKILSINDK